MAQVPTFTIPLQLDTTELDATIEKVRATNVALAQTIERLREALAALTAANAALQALLPAQKSEG